MVLIFSRPAAHRYAVSPTLGARLRSVTPALLLAGELFLLVFSDTNSWPLSHQRPITDKEVLMHKTYSALMLFFGFQGVRRRKRAIEADNQRRCACWAAG